ncbi:MAG: hypothetical protein CVV44_18405 [Spirochaetae bacterium HGW-Spirochaetae-1]|jgi:hypothetical protein|nr:MAG: hypothetical protein CVV44_18405 [Spirochaetae bacterium HGW-Spirochaetae-1]
MTAERTLICIYILIFAMTCVLMAQSDTIILNNEGYYNDKQRPSVSFPHGLHMAVVPECRSCHHIFQKGVNVLEESVLVAENENIRCVHCHGDGKNNHGQRIMDAYHVQCLGCHRLMQKKKKKAGPLMCGACHRKKDIR